MVKVLIAEDNVPISINLSNSINANSEVQAIAIINEGTRVYRKIKIAQPDILVLDLKMPGENGLQILDEITNDEELKNIKVVIYSGELDYIQRAIKYKNVVNFLDKGRTTIEDVSLYVKEIATNIESKSLNDEVLDRLVKMGFQTKNKGTKLLRDCIVFAINTNKENMKDAYKSIATINKSSEFTVKANIRGALENMWNTSNREQVRKYLRLGETDKPCNKDVFTMVKYYTEKTQ